MQDKNLQVHSVAFVSVLRRKQLIISLTNSWYNRFLMYDTSLFLEAHLARHGSAEDKSLLSIEKIFCNKLISMLKAFTIQ